VSDEYADRLKKLDALRGLGVDPFGARFLEAEPVGAIRARAEKGESFVAAAAGRIVASRGHGKAGFLDLRDADAKIQVYVRQDRVGEAAFELYKLLDLGDLLAVRGEVGKTKTGEVSIFAESLRLLTKALRPLPDKHAGLKDPELRFRKRYLDLIATPETRDVFRTRSRAVKFVRTFLDERGFMEVETPMMQPIPGGAAAKPFMTHHNALDLQLYLRIAPELYLKRLLVGGFEKVYEINRNFRNEGISVRHNPEFTMLELYWAYADYTDIAELTEALIHALAVELGCARLAGVARPWPRRPYRDLLREHAGIGLDDLAGAEALARRHQIKIEGPPGPKLVNDVFEKLVEPKLDGPVFVVEYPTAICPLTRRNPKDPSLADRFELFVDGMEIANAFTELNDPIDQRARFEKQLAERAEGMERLDEDFLLAMEHGMPPAGGLGVGIDRLVMLLTGQASIREVILFPLLRPSSE
jgi:lysyl-tRNA synthetase class 2